MPEEVLGFPDGFKWGAAVAAHQVEGGNTNNDWWAWEQQPGRIKRGQKSDMASNWWANAEADFDSAAGIGLNALRLSVEWSRIEPRPGEFDPAALQRYAAMLEGLRQRGIEPMVTLHHFTSPLWFAERGGWEEREAVDLFARFTRRVVEALGSLCSLWCTINEPNVYGYSGYAAGRFPPGKSSIATAMRVIRHLLLGHAAAYREIHSLQPQARVGLAHNMRAFAPLNPHAWLERLAAHVSRYTFNEVLLKAMTRGRWVLPLGQGRARDLRNTLDWIGLNYYTRSHIAFDLHSPRSLFARQVHRSDVEMLDGGYGEFYPEGMFHFLQRLTSLGLPVLVTEHGTPDDDDDQRPRHLLAHLYQLWRAMQAGCPVQGYYHWTLVDNFEWAEGWTLRFGLIAVDPATQAREPRRSAALYADIARANAITPQQVATYAPELQGELFPEV